MEAATGWTRCAELPPGSVDAPRRVASRSVKATSALETERSYDVAPGLVLPELAGVGGVAQVRALEDERLDATYYDTADLRLARSGITLRRRTGGRDGGWHLKLPVGGDSREEISLAADPLPVGPLPVGPLPVDGDPAVPAELHALVRARVRDAELVPVVRLHTQRAVRQLLDEDGGVLAELADDDVTAEVFGEIVDLQVWRELEIELVAGGEELLDAVATGLQDIGAVPVGWPSKLARVLGSRLSDSLSSAAGTRRTAGDAVLQHLREQVEELVSRDPGVRRDAPDAVHKMRVATRRLRSALKTCRPLLDRTVTDPVREELAFLAGVLGGARDAEVLRDRLRAHVAALPVELVLGPVTARIDSELVGRHVEAHGAVVAELDGPRYLALLDALTRLVEAPPWTARASRPARKQLRCLVRRTWRHLESAVAAADEAPTGEQRDELLHEARKIAKQVRYAAEAASDVLGADARRFAARVAAVQEALGEHQDSAVARDRLRELGAVAYLAGENGFTFGLLHGLERGRAREAEDSFVALWPALAGKHSRWLR